VAPAAAAAVAAAAAAAVAAAAAEAGGSGSGSKHERANTRKWSRLVGWRIRIKRGPLAHILRAWTAAKRMRVALLAVLPASKPNRS